MRKRDPILGEMKYCTRCREWWPLDDTFFFMGKPSYCRACWVDYYHSRKRAS